MTTQRTSARPVPDPRTPRRPGPDLALDERMQALEDAADAAMVAPSAHGSQPWTLLLHRDRIEVHADRSRQLPTLDPDGRELVQSLGAALFNVRVALAARGWGVTVDRLPSPSHPDVVAVVRPVAGTPEADLAALSDAVQQRHTHRAEFLAEEVPEELLAYLTRAAAAEGSGLVVVESAAHRRLLARLTREADAVHSRTPAAGAELHRWQPRSPTQGRPAADPGRARRTVDSDSGEDRTLVLLTSRADDPPSWLRSGEALQRVLLELTRLGWTVSPMTQVLEVPATRAGVRRELTHGAHPQSVLRIGHPGTRPAPPLRDRADVVRRDPHPPTDRRPVSDGRGGTTWA